MVLPIQVVRFCRWFRGWLWALKDAVPPYFLVDGPLEGKEPDPSGKFYILVQSMRIEVDEATFQILTLGESLQVRYTKGKRAINIDKLLPGNQRD